MGLDQWEIDYKAAQARVVTHPQFKNFGIKSFQSIQGRDGMAFNCEITFKGTVVASAHNGGQGGPDDVSYVVLLGKPAWQELIEAAAQKYEGDSMVLDCLLTAAGQ